MKAKNIEEFFGTLQQATVETWKEHLKTDKYSSHIALNEFYEDIVELVDTLIEDYMGLYGKVEDYVNLMSTDEIGAVEYLEELHDLVKSGRKDLFKEEDTELASDIDAILSLIDSTLYKLKELKESSFSLRKYLNKSLDINERMIYKDLYDALEENITRGIIEAWDDAGLEFTHKDIKDTLTKLAKEYNVDKHLDWTKEYMK
jgi:hypothetical protein